MPPDREQGRSYYDELSASYDAKRESSYHRMIDDLEVEVVEPLSLGARVLELGCGTGAILSRVAKSASEAIGIDASAEMVARARGKGLDARVAEIHALPFEDESFDLTYSFKALAHVPDVEVAIREATRVTRCGGHLVLELYNPWSLRFIAKQLAGPQQVTETHTEADIYTRWDPPARARSLIPPNTELVDLRGIRVLTPIAAALDLPLLGTILRTSERFAARSALRYFGGFLVLVLRKSRAAPSSES